MATVAGTTWSFSTEGLQPQKRATVLYGLCERGILPLQPLPGFIAQAKFTKLTFPGVSIMSGTLSGLSQIGPRDDRGLAAEVVLSVNLSGVSTIQHGGQDLTLRNGDAVLLSCPEDGFVAHRPTPANIIGLRLPHKELTSLVTNLDDAVMREIPGQSAPLRLLATYLRCLGAEEVLRSPELSHAVAAHVYDLVALSIGVSRDTAAIALGRGVRAARLLAIKADIARNLADPSLTITAIAARNGVTPRYIHKLFEGEGLTFSKFVMDRRLVAAHRLLSDRRVSYRPIISVAFDVGFSDLSYFNRTFRRKYNATPTDIRSGGMADARAKYLSPVRET